VFQLLLWVLLISRIWRILLVCSIFRPFLYAQSSHYSLICSWARCEAYWRRNQVSRGAIQATEHRWSLLKTVLWAMVYEVCPSYHLRNIFRKNILVKMLISSQRLPCSDVNWTFKKRAHFSDLTVKEDNWKGKERTVCCYLHKESRRTLGFIQGCLRNIVVFKCKDPCTRGADPFIPEKKVII